MRSARKLRQLRLPALLVVLGLAIVACGTDAGDDEPSDEESAPAAPDEAAEDPGQEPVSDSPTGDLLVVDSVFGHSTLDPAHTTDVSARMFNRVLYDTLLTIRPEDALQDAATPRPWLAESFDASDDATEFTFHLRDDVVFSDGTPLTAEDVVFSYNRVKNMKAASSFLLEGLSVEAIDDHTVVLRSEEPNSAVPAIASHPQLGILNSEAVRAEGGTDAEDADVTDEAEPFLNTTSTGSGPFVLQRHEIDAEIELVWNENHWSDPPGYERIVVRNVEPSTQFINVQQGETDVARDISIDVAQELDGVEIHTAPSGNVVFVYATTDPETHELASNPSWWEAFRYGIDYDRLVEVIGEGAQQTCGIVPRQFDESLPDDRCVSQDVERAQAAFERALEETGLVADEAVVELEFASDWQFGIGGMTAPAERIQADLRSIDIPIELRPAPGSTALERWQTNTAAMGLWDITLNIMDPWTHLQFVPGHRYGNQAGWVEGSDPEIEDLAERIESEGDAAARLELFHELQELMIEGSPFFPLFEGVQVVTGSGDVEGLHYVPDTEVNLAFFRPR